MTVVLPYLSTWFIQCSLAAFFLLIAGVTFFPGEAPARRLERIISALRGRPRRR